MTFDQTYTAIQAEGYEIDGTICPDNNQVITYTIRKNQDGQRYQIRQMIETTSLMNLEEEIMFQILKQQLWKMKSELEYTIFRDKNVYRRKVLIEKINKQPE